MSDPSDDRCMMDQVLDLRVEIAHGKVTIREAIDYLISRWELTRLGALDLLKRGPEAFR